MSQNQSENEAAKVLPDLGSEYKYHAFIAYAHEDKELAEKIAEILEPYGAKLMFADKEFQPGKTIVGNIEEKIHQSRRLLVICSKKFTESNWAQYEAIQGIQKMMTLGSQFVQIVKHNIQHSDMPKYLNWLTYIESDAEPEEFKKKIIWALSGETAVFAGVESYKLLGNGVGKGLAYSYFFSYLSVILPGLADKVEKHLKKPGYENVKMPKKFFLLVPETADLPHSIVKHDKQIVIQDKENDQFSQMVQRGGSERPYKNTILTIMDGPQKYQVLAEYATVLLPIHEMSQTDMITITDRDKLFQVQEFVRELGTILLHPKYARLGGMVEIVPLNEEENREGNLAGVLLEKIKASVLEDGVTQMSVDD
ncbi:unnamed protein product [Owenia fusiformis]|uniref:Uncharacterized protein n=1 Tax=Owenia fusiformis TaxID=6347 RepID=A0A8J1YA80_OWEFU|nr:unnamed protein product [Owenia fusiformis]